MRITVVGTGYVGLVVGTGLAENGHFVTAVDRDEEKICQLNAGELPIYEPGLEELMFRNVEEERLRFTTDLDSAVADSLLVFICVGTPSLEDGGADVSEVLATAEQVARVMKSYHIIVLKSTCPVGTAQQVREIMSGITTQPFDVVVNPEFLKEGAAMDDFMRPDRIVVGCDDVRVQEIMKELWAPFVRTGKPIMCMSPQSAEMTKYAVNVMLAARISLINELASICEAYDADIAQVREGLMTDTRIGSVYLFPGLGFGGSCLPKDTVACAKLGEAKGIPCELLRATTHVNDRQQTRFIERLFAFYEGEMKDKKIAIWGASFKPRTDDIRQAPALRIIDALLEAGASVSVYDPVAGGRLRAHYGDKVEVGNKCYAVLDEADGLVIATEWREFHYPDFERMGEVMRQKVIFDGRNLFSPKTLAQHGFRYFSVGRPSV